MIMNLKELEHHTPAPASVVHAADELLTYHRHASPMQLNIIVYSWTFSLDIDACGALPELAWRKAANLTAVAVPSRHPAVRDDVGRDSLIYAHTNIMYKSSDAGVAMQAAVGDVCCSA